MKQHKRLGLALGSGGPRGLAHIGVIKTIRDEGIAIHAIAGVSAGALVGGLYCAGGSVEKLLSITSSFGYRDFFSVFFAPTFSSGLVRTDKALSFLENILGGITIEELTIPFAAVATDLQTGEPVVIRTGSLARAIVASVSIPLLFEPSYYMGRFLVDGGVTIPVPVDVIKTMNIDRVLAVNLEHYREPAQSGKQEKPNAAQVTARTIDILKHKLADYTAQGADITLEPSFSFSSLDMRKFVHGDDIIKVGISETQTIIPKLKEIVS